MIQAKKSLFASSIVVSRWLGRKPSCEKQQEGQEISRESSGTFEAFGFHGQGHQRHGLHDTCGRALGSVGQCDAR